MPSLWERITGKKKRHIIELSAEKAQALEKIMPGFADPNQDANTLYERLITGLIPGLNSSMGMNHDPGSELMKLQVAASLATLYTKVSSTRLEMIKQVEKISTFYLVDVIVSQLSEGALSPEIGTGDILKVTSTKKEIKAEIE